MLLSNYIVFGDENLQKIIHNDKPFHYGNTELHVYQLGYEENIPGKVDGPYVREMYLLHYIVGGSGTFNGIRLQTGQGFLVRPGKIVHYYPDEDDPWKYYWIGFTGDLASSDIGKFGLEHNSCTFDYTWYNDIMPFLSNAFKVNMEFPDRNRYLNGIYSLLTSYHRATRETVDECQTQKRHVNRAVEYIHQNYFKPFKMSDLAGYLFIDRQYLCNLFKKFINISPQQYLVDYRISCACELLKNHTLSVADVARSVGYEDMFQFSKIFRRHRGVSPREYRKTHTL
jgi:AraC-like DNA-binding protein